MAFNKLILNLPHSSLVIPDDAVYEDYHQLLIDNNKWTDHYTDVIFHPSSDLLREIAVYKFPYSRFYIDAERLVNDPMEKNRARHYI